MENTLFGSYEPEEEETRAIWSTVMLKNKFPLV